MGIKDLLRGVLFGKRGFNNPTQKKKSLSQVISAVERAEVRTREFEKRAKNYHVRAQDALAHNEDDHAREYLSRWAYNRSMTLMYLQVQSNLQQQLDVMQEAEDVQVFNSALETARGWMTNQVKLMNLQDTVHERARLKAQSNEIQAMMRVYSRQMGMKIDNPQVEEELQRLKQLEAVKVTSNFPKVKIPEHEEEDTIPNEDLIHDAQELPSEKEKAS